MLKPTVIIQINSLDQNKNLPRVDFSWYETQIGWPATSTSTHISPNYKLYTLTRQLNMNSLNNSNLNKKKLNMKHRNYTPKDHRNLATIAYFSQLHDTHHYFKAIHHLKPYKIPWSRFAVHVAHMQVPHEEIFHVLNASLVALCRVDEIYMKTNPETLVQRNTSSSISSSSSRRDDELNLNSSPSSSSGGGGAFPNLLDLNKINPDTGKRLAVPKYECLGFGIIRGINMNTHEFYVLTPEPIEKLNQVNLLIKGILNIPVEFFYEQDAETPCPYVTFADNLNINSKNKTDVVAGEPIQRKFLMHHSTQSKK